MAKFMLLVPVVLVGVFLTRLSNAEEVTKEEERRAATSKCEDKLATELPRIGIDLLKGYFDHDKEVINDRCKKMKDYIDGCVKKYFIVADHQKNALDSIDYGLQTFCAEALNNSGVSQNAVSSVIISAFLAAISVFIAFLY